MSSSSFHTFIQVPLKSHQICHQTHFPEQEPEAPGLQSQFLCLQNAGPPVRLERIALATAPPAGGDGHACATFSPAPRRRKRPNSPSRLRRLSSAPPKVGARRGPAQSVQPGPDFPAALVAAASGQNHPWGPREGGGGLRCRRLLRRE